MHYYIGLQNKENLNSYSKMVSGEENAADKGRERTGDQAVW